MKPVADLPEEHLTATIINLRTCPETMKEDVVKVVLSEDGTSCNKDIQDILSKHPRIVSLLVRLYGLDVFANQFLPKHLIEMRKTVWGVSSTSTLYIQTLLIWLFPSLLNRC